MQDPSIHDRRNELIENIDKIKDRLVNPNQRELYASYWDRIIAIDTLEAQARLARSQEQLAAAQEAATAAQMAETERQNQIRGRSDEQSYWFRRFLTSLTVAHGVGLATCLTALMRTPSPQVSGEGAFAIVTTFALGLAFMGSLPIPMARIDPRNPDDKKDKQRLFTAYCISAVSTVLLGLGLLCVGKVAFDTFQFNQKPAATETLIQVAHETAPPPSPASH